MKKFFLPAFLILAVSLYRTGTGEEEAVQNEAGSMAEEEVYEEAVEGEGIKLPPLIQATTLKSDYEAIASLGLAFTPLTTKDEAQQAYENILCSCVRVQVEGYYGSGSIYKMPENEIIIVTNRHVLQYWNEDSYVTFFNGAVAGGEVLLISEEADVGFINVPVGAFTYEELLKYRNVRGVGAGTEQVKELSGGSRIFMVDMASDWRNPVRMDGEIILPLIYLEDFQSEMLYGKGEAVPGMSGSGVFDGFGNYLGMLTGGTLQGEIAAVPEKIVEEEYEKMLLKAEK